MKENIFNWKIFNSWEKEFGRFLNTLLPSKFISNTKIKFDEIHFDWAGPFEKYIHDENDNCFYDIEFKDYFVNTYTHILTYHGCRPTDIQNYYNNGFLILNTSTQNENFSKIFYNEKFKEISLEDIEYAINAVKKEGRENQLFWGIDDRILVERAGHYLIYGSEYIMCLAANLSERLKRDYRHHLRNYGIPTIFKVKLPISIIDENDLIHLFPYLYRLWVYNKLKNKITSYGLNYSFFLKKNIPPECIITHYHPDKIRDYHNKGKIYIRKSNSYKKDKLSAL